MDGASNEDLSKIVTNLPVSIIVKQCGKANDGKMFSVSYGSGSSHKPHQHKNGNGQKPSFSMLKSRLCHRFGNYGHWNSSHREGRSLCGNVKLYITAPKFSADSVQPSGNNDSSHEKNGTNRKTLFFNMARVSKNESVIALDPLVDDGTEYSAIGCIELKLCQDLASTLTMKITPFLHLLTKRLIGSLGSMITLVLRVAY